MYYEERWNIFCNGKLLNKLLVLYPCAQPETQDQTLISKNKDSRAPYSMGIAKWMSQEPWGT